MGVDAVDLERLGTDVVGEEFASSSSKSQLIEPQPVVESIGNDPRSFARSSKASGAISRTQTTTQAVQSAPIVPVIPVKRVRPKPPTPKLPTSKKELGTSPATFTLPSDEWSCPICTLFNPSLALTCEACTTTRPKAKEKHGVDGWYCEFCNAGPRDMEFWSCLDCGWVRKWG